MNIKKQFLQITGFIFLLCASSAIIARPALLVNNSYFPIAFRAASAGSTGKIPEYQLQPGQTAEIDTQTLYSIRRSGVGSEYASSYYNVPNRELLQEAVTNDPGYAMHAKWSDTPIIRIYSGIPYGWSFTLDWKIAKRT